MRIVLSIIFLFLVSCATHRIVQGQGIEFSGIAVDTVTTPKEKTK
jgi:hypothetical protein